MPFDVFLCHNSLDKGEVRRLNALLKAHSLLTWFDEEQLIPGRLWQDALEEQLGQIRAVAVCISDSGNGPWQHLELNAAIREFVDRRMPVIPVILPGCQGSPRFPLFLRGFHRVDMREPHPDPIQQIVRGVKAGQQQHSSATPTPAAPARKPFLLQSVPHELFFGRDEFLKSVHATLNPDTPAAGSTATMAITDTARARAIYGLGGIGKTRASVEYGHRYGHKYSAVLSIRADTPETLRNGMVGLAGPTALNLPDIPADMPPEDCIRAVLHWLADNPVWLLIIDNVDTDEAAGAVEEMVRRMQSGRVLITSRIANWSSLVKTLDIDLLSRQDAVDFLFARAGTSREKAATQAADVASATDIADRLDGLPLALEQAGAYIAKEHISFADYMQSWNHEKARLEVLGFHHERLMPDYPVSVAVTWSTSFNKLDAPAKALLELLSFLSPEPIPWELLETDEAPDILAEAQDIPPASASVPGQPRSPMRMKRLRGQLISYSLVRLLEKPAGCISIHRLVQEIVRQSLPEPLSSERWMQTVRLVRAYAPDGGQESATWPRWTRLAGHIEFIFEKAMGTGDPESIPYLLNGYGQFLSAQFADTTATTFFRRFITSAVHLLAPEHPNKLDIVNNLLSLSLYKNDYTASPLFQDTLKVLGPENPLTMFSFLCLAFLEASNGHYAVAEPYYHKAAEGLKKQLGPEHPMTINAIRGWQLCRKKLAQSSP